MRRARFALAGLLLPLACNAITGADHYTNVDGDAALAADGGKEASSDAAGCPGACLNTAYACGAKCANDHAACVAACSNQGCVNKCDGTETTCEDDCRKACQSCGACASCAAAVSGGVADAGTD